MWRCSPHNPKLSPSSQHSNLACPRIRVHLLKLMANKGPRLAGGGQPALLSCITQIRVRLSHSPISGLLTPLCLCTRSYLFPSFLNPAALLDKVHSTPKTLQFCRCIVQHASGPLAKACTEDHLRLSRLQFLSPSTVALPDSSLPKTLLLKHACKVISALCNLVLTH